MILHLGGRSREDAAAMLARAAHALAPRMLEASPPRRFKIPARLARIERERMRTKVEGTRALAHALTEAVATFRREALGSLGLREADARALDHVRLEEDTLARAFRPTLEQQYLAGVQSAVAELRSRKRAKRESATTPDEDAELSVDLGWDVVPQDAIDALYARTLKFSKDVVEREKSALQRMIANALAEGEPASELADHIREFFGAGMHVVDAAGNIVRTIPEDSWIDMVARTEVARANNAGVTEVYRRAKVAQIMWLAAEDERTCPVCEMLDGAIVKLGDAFPGTDATEPPEHPSCRCTSIAAEDAGDEEES